MEEHNQELLIGIDGVGVDNEQAKDPKDEERDAVRGVCVASVPRIGQDLQFCKKATVSQAF